MLEIFCSVFMLIGSIIGAGFASGKEIAVYFCPYASNMFYLVVFTIFNIVFVFSCLVLSAKTSGINQLNKSVLKKAYPFFHIVNFVSYLLFCSSMFAALVKLFNSSFLLLILTLVFCYFVVLFKSKGLKIFSVITVPIMIIYVLIVGLVGYDASIKYTLSLNIDFLYLIKIVFYLSINLLLAYGGVFVIKISSKKKCFLIAVISSLILSLLVFVLSNAINSAGCINETFPLFRLIKNNALFSSIFNVIIWCGITTTFCSCMCCLINILTKEKESKFDISIKLLFIFIVAGLLSLIGFDFIVEYGYMILGFFAFVYFILIISSSLRKFFFKQSNTKIH